MSLLLRVTAACWLLSVVVLVVWALASASSLPLVVAVAFTTAWAIIALGSHFIGGQGWDDAREP
jgi:hypothetical protein